MTDTERMDWLEMHGHRIAIFPDYTSVDGEERRCWILMGPPAWYCFSRFGMSKFPTLRAAIDAAATAIVEAK